MSLSELINSMRIPIRYLRQSQSFNCQQFEKSGRGNSFWYRA